MTEKKKRNILFDEADEYLSYFDDEIQELAKVIEKLLSLQEISDKQIAMLDSTTGTPTRGSQVYITEHIANAIQIQSQMQSVLKDKRSLKEKSLELAIKMSSGEGDGDSSAIMAALNTMIRQSNKERAEKADALEAKIMDDSGLSDAELDKKIDEKLDS